MSEEVKPGIAETKEAAVAVIAVAVKLVKLSKDGIQLSDVASLLADEELKGLLVKGSEGMGKIPGEVKDLSLEEGLELALAVVPALVDGLKK